MRLSHQHSKFLFMCLKSHSRKGLAIYQCRVLGFHRKTLYLVVNHTNQMARTIKVITCGWITKTNANGAIKQSEFERFCIPFSFEKHRGKFVFPRQSIVFQPMFATATNITSLNSLQTCWQEFKTIPRSLQTLVITFLCMKITLNLENLLSTGRRLLSIGQTWFINQVSCTKYGDVRGEGWRAFPVSWKATIQSKNAKYNRLAKTRVTGVPNTSLKTLFCGVNERNTNFLVTIVMVFLLTSFKNLHIFFGCHFRENAFLSSQYVLSV